MPARSLVGFQIRLGEFIFLFKYFCLLSPSWSIRCFSLDFFDPLVDGAIGTDHECRDTAVGIAHLAPLARCGIHSIVGTGWCPGASPIAIAPTRYIGTLESTKITPACDVGRHVVDVPGGVIAARRTLERVQAPLRAVVLSSTFSKVPVIPL